MYLFYLGSSFQLFAYRNTITKNQWDGIQLRGFQNSPKLGLLSNILWENALEDTNADLSIVSIADKHLFLYHNVIGARDVEIEGDNLVGEGSDPMLTADTFCPKEGSSAIGQGVCCGQRPAASLEEKPETLCFKPSEEDITCSEALTDNKIASYYRIFPPGDEQSVIEQAKEKPPWFEDVVLLDEDKRDGRGQCYEGAPDIGYCEYREQDSTTMMCE